MNATSGNLRLRLAAATALVSTLAVGVAATPAAAGEPGAGPPSAGHEEPPTQRQLQRAVDETLEDAGYVGVSVGVREGGRREAAGEAVVISASGKNAGDTWQLNAEKALQKLVDRAMCGQVR